jgi:hypothetical protein
MKEPHFSHRQRVASISSVAAESPHGVRVLIRHPVLLAALSMRLESLELCVVTVDHPPVCFGITDHCDLLGAIGVSFNVVL